MRKTYLTVIFLAVITGNIFGQAWEWGANIPGDRNLLVEDASGNLYTMGRFNGGITIGNDNLYTSSESSYLTKCNSMGTFLWAIKFDAIIKGMKILNNEIIIAGYFGGSLSYGDTNLVSVDTDVFIGSVKLSGKYGWIKQFSGPGNQKISSMDISSQGEILVTGNNDSLMQCENIFFNKGMFVGVFNNNLKLTHHFQIEGEISPREISSDKNGNIYLLSVYYRTVIVEDDTLEYGDMDNGAHFIGKFSYDGKKLWTIGLGSSYWSSSENLT